MKAGNRVVINSKARPEHVGRGGIVDGVSERDDTVAIRLDGETQSVTFELECVDLVTMFDGKMLAALFLKAQLDDEDRGKVMALVEEVGRLREENADLRRWLQDVRRNVIACLPDPEPPENESNGEP